MRKDAPGQLKTSSLGSTRRDVVGGVAAIGTGIAATGFPLSTLSQVAESVRNVKALTFDVFGTVVDWYTSLVREGELLGRRNNLDIDWGDFALRWRAGYGPAMQAVRSGDIPYMNIDALHRMILDELLQDFGIDVLSEQETDDFNRAWHRLIPWSDVIPGLYRLKSRYVIATLSNGNVSLLTNMAKNAGLPWDVILSSELAAPHFKTDSEVYETAADLLDLDPDEVMMVAAHKRDLEGARGVGFRTAYIRRPLEQGPNGNIDTTPDPLADINADGFIDLAGQLGA
jgi:2-haloacid dehalogenase